MKKSLKTRRTSTEKNGASTAETKLTPENIAVAIRLGIERFVDASLILQALAEKFPEGDEKRTAILKCRREIDDRFAISLRSNLSRHLAKTTESTELLFDTVSEALSAADDLPELLRLADRFMEPTDLNATSSDSFYFHFAEMVVGLVKHLEELCTKYPERFRLLARELPYWPMLVFRHKAANNHLFEKTADGQKPLAEMLELGSDCPINVSNRASYSLKTPINAFLWSILSELHWGRGWVHSIASENSDATLRSKLMCSC